MRRALSSAACRRRLHPSHGRRSRGFRGRPVLATAFGPRWPVTPTQANVALGAAIRALDAPPFPPSRGPRPFAGEAPSPRDRVRAPAAATPAHLRRRVRSHARAARRWHRCWPVRRVYRHGRRTPPQSSPLYLISRLAAAGGAAGVGLLRSRAPPGAPAVLLPAVVERRRWSSRPVRMRTGRPPRAVAGSPQSARGLAVGPIGAIGAWSAGLFSASRSARVLETGRAGSATPTQSADSDVGSTPVRAAADLVATAADDVRVCPYFGTAIFALDVTSDGRPAAAGGQPGEDGVPARRARPALDLLPCTSPPPGCESCGDGRRGSGTDRFRSGSGGCWNVQRRPRRRPGSTAVAGLVDPGTAAVTLKLSIRTGPSARHRSRWLSDPARSVPAFSSSTAGQRDASDGGAFTDPHRRLGPPRDHAGRRVLTRARWREGLPGRITRGGQVIWTVGVNTARSP